MSDSVVSAVLQATRVQDEVHKTHARELQELRREKESITTVLTSQISGLHEELLKAKEHAAQVEGEARTRVARAHEQLAAKTEGLAEARLAVEVANEERRREAVALGESRDRAVTTLAAELARSIENEHALQGKVVEYSSLIDAAHIAHTETGVRSQLAIQATVDRAVQYARKLRTRIWERDRAIIKLQSELLAASHTRAADLSSSETEIVLLQQNKLLLDRALAEEQTKRQIATERTHTLECALEARNAELRTIRDAVDGELTALHDKDTEKAKEITALKTELEQVRKIVLEFETENKRLLELFRSVREERDTVMIEIEQLNRQHESSKLQHADAVESHRISCETRLREVQQELENAQRWYNETMIKVSNTHVDEIQRHLERVAEMEVKLTECTRQLDASNAIREEVAQSLHHSAEEVCRLQEHAKSLSNELTLNRTELDKSRAQCEVQEADLACARQEAARSGVELRRLELEFFDMSARASSAEARRNELQQTVSTLEANLSSTQRELLQANQRITDLNSTESLLRDQIRSLEEAAAVGSNVRELLTALSMKSQELAESLADNANLRERVIILEAQYATTETRLHHSIDEGTAASVLLERGLKRHNASDPRVTQILGGHEGTETAKSILLKSAHTLRKALEDQGLNTANLPLAPSNSLEIPFLQQVLLDHVALAAKQLKASSTFGGTIHSATRTPKVFRDPSVSAIGKSNISIAESA